MTKMGFQFHADPAEFDRLVGDWIDGLDFEVAAEIFWPSYQVLSVDGSTVGTGGLEVPGLSRVVLSRIPIDVHVSTSREFLQKNFGCLTILVGRLTSEGLSEAFLSAASDDPEDLVVWRKMIRRVNKSMHRGGVVVNTWSGARQENTSHRYTAGALTLFERGVAMRATDAVIYELGRR